MWTDEEIAEIMSDLGLPELPADDDYDSDDEDYDSAPRELFVSRHRAENVPLPGTYCLEDVKAYCEREDTHGDGWFVGFRRA